jgi:lysyl oxidase-like protein 2/3/4
MAGVFERAGIYKLGSGGMTAFARAILRDFRGDVLFNTVVEKVDQGRNGVLLQTKDGRKVDAKAVVSTIPL